MSVLSWKGETMGETIGYDGTCFCCGKNNDAGLKLDFEYPEPGTARTTLRVPRAFTGWRNITHGGFLSMLIDETMAHACVSLGRNMVTAEMTVRYRKPVPVESDIEIVGAIERIRGRIASVKATVYDGESDVVAEGSGRFLDTGPSPADGSQDGLSDTDRL